MTAPEINVVLIGCGAFARRYHVPTLEADPGVKLAAICDPGANDDVHALATRTGALLVDKPEQLPSPSGTTIALVTSPHTLHAEHCAFALSRNWHVLCDKPFVMHAAEARALAAEASHRRRIAAVAFNRRTDRGCLAAREMIRRGDIGAVRYVETIQLGYETRGWFIDPKLGGGGPFTGRGTHMADLVPWLLDRRPTQLRARVRDGSASGIDRGGVVEVLFGDLEHHLVCMTEGWHMWDEVRIFGEDGLIELRRPLDQFIGWELRVATRRGGDVRNIAADPNIGGATRNFLDAVRGEGAAACSFDDALTSVRVIEEAFASAAENGAWRQIS